MKIITPRGKSGINKSILVDDKDYEKLKDFKWYISQSGYAVCYETGKTHKTRRRLIMHRIILNAKKDEYVDHKNRNRADNGRCFEGL